MTDTPEERAKRRFHAELWDVPDGVMVPDEFMESTFLYQRLLLGEHFRDLWTEVPKPIVRLLDWLTRK